MFPGKEICPFISTADSILIVLPSFQDDLGEPRCEVICHKATTSTTSFNARCPGHRLFTHVLYLLPLHASNSSTGCGAGGGFVANHFAKTEFEHWPTF